MGPIRILGALAVLAAAGCAAPPAPAPTTGTATTPPTATTSTSAQAPLGAAIREWEAVAGNHFKESAQALEEVADSAGAEDEAAVRAACRRLHDTNSGGLQGHLPTPDPELTAELQKMIDDMNTATHACLRFTETRADAEATTYQTYLARAVAHLERAKVILEADLGR